MDMLADWLARRAGDVELRLKPYQMVGLNWLYLLHKQVGVGCAAAILPEACHSPPVRSWTDVRGGGC